MMIFDVNAAAYRELCLLHYDSYRAPAIILTAVVKSDGEVRNTMPLMTRQRGSRQVCW